MNVPSPLDPEIAAHLLKHPPAGPLNLRQREQIRASRRAASAAITLSGAVDHTDYTVPGGAPNDPGVTIRVYRAKDATGTLPCLYWIHGGGYVFGHYADEDIRFDKWCPALNCVGVSVEYRLSPETPYPGPLDDCYAGLAWVHANAEMLGIDPTRIAIGGSSAGGGLAAALALLARDRGTPPIAAQLLLYPMIDDRRTTPSSQWEGVPVWPPASNERGWMSYLGPLCGIAEVPAYAAPARAEDLSGLPPTFIPVGSLDIFLDEDLDYARRLIDAGVPTDFRIYAGAPHGFDSQMPGTQLARRFRRDLEAWLLPHLHPEARTLTSDR